MILILINKTNIELVVQTINTILIPEDSKKPLKITVKIDTKDLPKELKNTEKFVDLIMTAEKIKKNPADYEVSEVNWGHFRFFLNKDNFN